MGESKMKFQGEEKVVTKKNGFTMLFMVILGFIASIAICAFGGYISSKGYVIGGVLIFIGIVICILSGFMCGGFHVVNPNEAMVFTLFGQYYGTIREEGFYCINPFATSISSSKGGLGNSIRNALELSDNNTSSSITSRRRVSLKTMTLDNDRQKVNDALGNPIIIGAIVIWKVVNPTKAMFNVDDYYTYLSIQCDSTVRNIARLYPYDLMEEEENEEEHEKTLRGSSQEIAESMKAELGKRMEEAGIVVEEVRITHLSYAEEIAAAMLQKQQATAVIAARRKIVEGGVSMVDMALEQLSEKEIVVLDEERKAAMVSNLLVVLCGHQEAQPIINSGSIY